MLFTTPAKTQDDSETFFLTQSGVTSSTNYSNLNDSTKKLANHAKATSLPGPIRSLNRISRLDHINNIEKQHQLFKLNIDITSPITVKAAHFLDLDPSELLSKYITTY